MSFLGREYLPEPKASFAVFEDWASKADRVPGASLLSKKVFRVVGRIEFPVRGRTRVPGVARTNTSWALQRIDDAFDALSADEQPSVRAALFPLGVAESLDLRPTHRLDRCEYTEVWADPA